MIQQAWENWMVYPSRVADRAERVELLCSPLSQPDNYRRLSLAPDDYYGLLTRRSPDQAALICMFRPILLALALASLIS